MRVMIRLFLLVMLALPGLAAPLAAQNSEQVQPQATEAPKPKVVIDKRKLLVPPRNPDGSFMETPFTEDPVRWARDKQMNFYARLSGALKGIASGSPLKAGWTLVLISFLYGVFHAAGPGHGKAVISGWLLATRNDLRRGIVIAGMSSLFQALTAIIIVGGLLFFVSSAATMARDVAGFLESASYLMIAGVGLYLVWTSIVAVRSAVSSGAMAVAPSGVTTRVHDGFTFDAVTPRDPLPAGHVHGPDCGCGHAHLPEAAEVRGDWSWSKAVTLSLAIGLRPCSGALLMLMFAWSIGIFWAGILSTLAMGVGVFITISLIAALAVFAKSAARRYSRFGSQTLERIVMLVRLAVGLAIAGLGALMFWASLGGVNSMM
jgi:nickel/cobalt transporter (NicO) family protein